MHAIRRLLPISLIALSSALGQAPNDPQPLPPGVPAEAPTPTPAPAVKPVVPAAPAVKPVVPPVPGAAVPVPGAPGAAVAANQANVPLGDRKIIESIIEPKMTGNDLAGKYSAFTGRRVIVSAAAAAAELSFVQQASAADPLTYREAAKLLKMQALMEGFVFVPAGDTDPNVDKLMFSAASAGPKGEGLEVLNENDELPDDDRVVAYVMTLKFLKPDEAVRVFTTIVGQFGSYGSLAAITNASAIVITEKTSLIRKLIELKEVIDKPSSDVATRFFKVQYADPTELAETLNQMLNTQQQAQRTSGIQRTDVNPVGNVPNPAGGATGGARSSGGSAEETPPQIIPDARTNRIFAMGRPVDLLFIEGLVREFDTQSDQKNTLRRRLRYISVSSFLDTAENALNRAFTGSGSGTSGGGAGGGAGSTGANFGGGNRTSGGSTGSRTSGSSGGRSSSSSQGSSGSSSFGGSGGSGGGGSGGGADVLSDPNTDTGPTSRLVGRTLLVADNVTNSIVVQGTPASLEVISRLLDQIDVKAEQVMIATVFGQLSLSDNMEYGIDYLRSINPAGAAKGNSQWAGGSNTGSAPTATGTGTTKTFYDIASMLSPSTLPTTGGLNVYGMLSNQFSVYLHALQSSGNFTVLSRPSIYTNNNQKGVISSGQRIAVPSSTYNGGSTGSSTNIEYRDVVLKLEVIPLVNSDREITLQIALLNDDVVGEQTVQGAGTVPIIGTRELLTTVTVPNSATVVLGGLITTSNKDSVSGIPILSSIPGLGKLFSTTIKTKERSELVIFIQPTIVGNEAAHDAVQRDADARYKLAPDIHNFNNGPAVIPPPDSIVPVNEKASDYSAAGPVKTVKGNAVVEEAPSASKKSSKRLGHPGH